MSEEITEVKPGQLWLYADGAMSCVSFVISVHAPPVDYWALLQDFWMDGDRRLPTTYEEDIEEMIRSEEYFLLVDVT